MCTAVPLRIPALDYAGMHSQIGFGHYVYWPHCQGCLVLSKACLACAVRLVLIPPTAPAPSMRPPLQGYTTSPYSLYSGARTQGPILPPNTPPSPSPDLLCTRGRGPPPSSWRPTCRLQPRGCIAALLGPRRDPKLTRRGGAPGGWG